MSKRFFGTALMGAVVFPALIQGCSSDATNPLCCNEFKVGATINADIGGSAQSQVAAQAVADFSGIASAAVDDLTTACRNIAQDLDATKADQDAAEAKSDKRDRLNAWCALAVKAVGNVKAQANASITVTVVPPKCEASISAKANCQAKCSVDGKCDIKANPPKCTGGSLSVACKGECTAKAGATLHCEGTCSASCKGECTAQGGVQCAGECQGTCEGAGGAGTNGTDASGKCQGTCKGTCKATAPGVTCTGSCKGECGGSCTGSANASVTCDGECKADFEPLKCEGGKLEGGCQVDAKCDANCDASVSAKAECTPPEVAVVVTGSAEFAGKLKATLEANLSLVFGLKARLDGMASIAASFSGNVSAVTDIKVACIPPMVAAVQNAVQDVSVSAKASADIVASAK